MAAAAAPTFRLTQCLRCSRRLRYLHGYRCLPHQSRPPDADDADGADGADDRAAQAPVRACALLPQVAFMVTSACDGRDSGWAWSGVVGVRGKGGGGACSALPRSLWHGAGPASLPLAPAMRPLPARGRVGALVSHFVGSSPPSFVSCPVRVSLFGFAFARRRSAGPRRSTTTVRRSVAPLTRHVYVWLRTTHVRRGAGTPRGGRRAHTARARARSSGRRGGATTRGGAQTSAVGGAGRGGDGRGVRARRCTSAPRAVLPLGARMACAAVIFIREDAFAGACARGNSLRAQ